MIDPAAELSIVRQCELIELAHSSYYYQPVGETPLNLELMGIIDRQYLETPAYGVGMMHAHLRALGFLINAKRVQRLYRLMGIEGLVPRPSLSKPAKGRDHSVHPYLLRDVVVERANQVWSTDITYVPLPSGFLYLTAVVDWYTRFILSWEISNSLENTFCCEALERALELYGCPEIFNTDQGSQFTAHNFTSILSSNGIAISMDGRGRALDNVFIERFWRSYKYEYLYLCVPESGAELYRGTGAYVQHFNASRPHSALGGRSPADLYLLDA
jgi:putative transposase